MASVIKKIIQWKLKLLAAAYIKLKRIEIVAITGSAGKTTAKITLSQIIPEKLLYVPKEAYNTEYGVPLALFRGQVPINPRSFIGWVAVFIKMLGKLFLPSPYRRIVLEYGADKPGDIDYLTSFARPHIAVVTTVLPVHLEGFSDTGAVAKEKGKLIECLTADDFAVLNSDDKRVLGMREKTRAHVITYGKVGADVVCSNLRYNETGMAFDILWKGSKYPVVIPILAPQLLPSYLSAFTVGLLLGEDPKVMAKRLSHITPERGRMNPLAGLHGSLIIDDSYNSNPESAKAALAVLAEYPGRKIAVLGSMNELGDFAEKGHVQVAEAAVKAADVVVTVGEVAARYLYPVLLEKMNNKFIQKFDNSSTAGEYLRDIVQEGDTVLVKGSQNGVFAEEAVKSILLDPKFAPEVLVRQGAMWQNKKGLTHE